MSRVLVLVDEIGTAGLPPARRRLIAALAEQTEVTIVARCYLGQGHRARRLPFAAALYGFEAEDHDAKVARFAADLVARDGPAWALSLGWENNQLVDALDDLDLPVVALIDRVPQTAEADGALYGLVRVAAAVLFADPAVPARLGAAKRALDARGYEIVAPRRGRQPAEPGLLARLLAGGRPQPVDPETRRLAARVAVIGHGVAEAGRIGRPVMARDVAAIRDAFDPDLYQGHAAAYLRASRRAVPRARPLAGRLLRRPAAGFNPLVYAAACTSFDESRGEDPFAHFLRAGRPTGPWAHEVIDGAATVDPPALTVALHGHFHYPELLPDLLERLRANRARPTLFITTTSEAGRAEIVRMLAQATIAAEVAVCGNRGRDLLPFLDLLGRGAFDRFDLVGHVHGKRSPAYSAGATWRDFLWTHLIGGPSATMDVVLARLAADGGLGLVFPEDPHLDGWESNLAAATDLARRIGLALPLPTHFDYPMGTMFWARTAALAPFRAVAWTEETMPAEPLPDDGTILHALERLIPFVVAEAGFRFATTHVPGSGR